MSQRDPVDRFVVGPVLYVRGLSDEWFDLTVIVVMADDSSPPELQTGGRRYEPMGLSLGDLPSSIWHYQFSIPIQASRETATYRLGHQEWTIHLPQRDRLRLAVTSCNGDAHEILGEASHERNERWRHLAHVHAQHPFHFLLQIGDQLYADALWREIPALAAWAELDADEQERAPWTPELEQEVSAFYYQSYCRLWSQPDLVPLLASIPSLMMWDDHDIFDGWGSYAPARQNCPIHQGIWRVARRYFVAFQLGTSVDQLPDMFGDPSGGHFGYAIQIGEVGIIAPDLRSERTWDCVIGEAGWSWFCKAVEDLSHCRQLFLIFSVPVVHLSWSGLERVLTRLQLARGYHDDIRDQWQSLGHRAEWERLLAFLLDVAAQVEGQITLLSGEVHLSSWGTIERGSTRIAQVVSSGVVHHPPHSWAVRFFELLSRWSTRLLDHTHVSVKLLPHVNRRFLSTRSWASLDYGPQRNLQVTWHPEGGDDIELRL